MAFHVVLNERNANQVLRRLHRSDPATAEQIESVLDGLEREPHALQHESVLPSAWVCYVADTGWLVIWAFPAVDPAVVIVGMIRRDDN